MSKLYLRGAKEQGGTLMDGFRHVEVRVERYVGGTLIESSIWRQAARNITVVEAQTKVHVLDTKVALR